MNDTLSIKVNDGEYKIVYYSPEIVETSFIPSSEAINKGSSLVVLTPEKVKFTVLENESSLTIDSEGIDINISKNPFQLKYMFNDKEVISERTGFSKREENHKIEFNITPEELLFKGEVVAPGMNLRGNRLELNNTVPEGNEEKSELISYTLPIVFSSNIYLINFENATVGFLDLDSKEDNTLSYETISGRKTYQLVVGDTWEKIIENYTGLTGRQPMPPRWALDNLLSGNEDHSQKEDLENDPARINSEKPDDEHYLRLLQNGVFQPVYRTHTSEDVLSGSMYGDQGIKALVQKAIELRYQLLPYNYTLAYQNSISGLPLMRPLFFEEPDNKEIYEAADTYLWGKDILVSPVMSSGLKEKLVVFPGNSNWFDAYSGKKYSGGTIQNIPVVKEHIPTFVRGGAFIPMAKPVQTTSNYTGENLEVHYYFDEDVKESSGFLYHDDGKTLNAFGEKKYEIIKFTSNQEPKILNLRIEKEAGGEATEEIQLIEVIIENLKKPVDVVWVNTLRFTAKNYMHQGKLVIPVRFDNEVTTIKLEFN